MQAVDAGKPTQEPDEDTKKDSPLWERIKSWDSKLSVAKGFVFVGLLTSLFGGFFQYLSAYDQKVSDQAKEDMTQASATFEEISNSFAEMQALQQILYSDFTSAVRTRSDASEQALDTRNAREISDTYEKARVALREKIDVLARKAEIYIDWASDVGRDPAAKRDVDQDPLTRTLLRAYKFDCANNFPRFGKIDPQHAPTPEISDADFCAATQSQMQSENEDPEISPDRAFNQICASKDDKKDDKKHDKTATRIYWYSAKHHVLTMHNCFEASDRRLEAVRDWASKSDRDKRKEDTIMAETAEVSTELDNLSRRLNGFTSLALFQMERIRVKYRPVSFACSLLLLRDVLNIFSTMCLPVRTAAGR
jgi:hypothetical protein